TVGLRSARAREASPAIRAALRPLPPDLLCGMIVAPTVVAQLQNGLLMAGLVQAPRSRHAARAPHRAMYCAGIGTPTPAPPSSTRSSSTRSVFPADRGTVTGIQTPGYVVVLYEDPSSLW